MSQREPSKSSKGKRIWSAKDAAEAESETETEDELLGSPASSDVGSEHPPSPVARPSMLVFGTGAVSQYTTVVHTGVVHASLVFPLQSTENYTVVEYTIKHSDKRSSVFRARAVTTMGPDGGLEHHVIETIDHERKAIDALFAAKQVAALDIAKRVNTKNTARNALACIKNGQWDIHGSKNRDSYKKLMVAGFGPNPTLVFSTMYAKHLIKAEDKSEPPTKRSKHDAVVGATTDPAPVALAPQLCQNMVWIDELEAILSRAPAGMEKTFTSAMFKLLRSTV
jgi:hypothetical protein